MLHYTACGLDNVWLKNGYEVKKTPYGEAIAVSRAQALHELIACDLVKKKGRLTSDEFRFMRNQLGLSQALLADLLGVDEQSVSNWERRRTKVPTSADMVLRLHVQKKCDGDMPLTKALERIKLIDQLVHQRIVARTDARHRWSSVIKDDAECEPA